MTYTPTDADVERAAETLVRCVGASKDEVTNFDREATRAILTAHHAELERQGWQMVRWEPIETAPRDGLDVLIAGGTYFDSGSVVTDPMPASGVNVAGYRKCGAESHCWQGDESNSHDDHYWYEPTHRTPLPKPPGGDK